MGARVDRYIDSDAERELRKRELDIEEREAKLAKEEREKNHHFVQLSINEISTIAELSKQNPFGLEIYLFMVEHMDNKNALVCPYKVLQEVFGKSRQHISNTVKWLNDNGFIKIAKAGNANIYYINSHIWWKGKGDARKYAECKATVLIAKSENPQIEWNNRKHIENK